MMKWTYQKYMAEALLAGCVLAALQAPAFAQTTPEILNYTGADRQEFLEAGAREEGDLVFYTAMVAEPARALIAAFTEKYPFISVTDWRGDAVDIPMRVLAESRANNMVADVIESTGVSTILTRAEVVEPFSTPALNDYLEIHRDPEGNWAPTRLSYFCMAYNTDMVSAEDVPKTFEDLLDPRWKGQIAWRIGTDTGTPFFITNLRQAWGEEKAEEYLQKLAEQDIVNFGAGSARTLVDRVIAGEYALAVNVFCHHPLISAADGAPVASQLMNPVASAAATVLIPKGVRHPYAAALFTDFLLTEGQEIFKENDYFPARPGVTPSELLAPIVPQIAGYDENFIRPDVSEDAAVRSDELYQQYFR